MKRMTFAVGLLLALGAGGCDDLVLSLQPLATDQTTVTDARLAGKWACDDQVWESVSTDSNDYQVRIAQMLSSGTFQAKLVEVGGQRFLDILPTDAPQGQGMGMMFALHLVSTHSFWRVNLEGPSLRLEVLKRETLGKILGEDPELLDHQEAQDRLVLSGPPEQMQAFLAAHADANDLWKEGISLERCTPLYTRDQVILDPNLNGRWSDPNVVLDIAQPEARLYRLNAWAQDSVALGAWAYLVQGDRTRFLAVFSEKPPFNPKDPQSDLVPDMVLLVGRTGDQLRLKGVSLDDATRCATGDPNAPSLEDADTLTLTR
ncbi:MAG: hypothetical protein KBE04_10305 [Phycisphaerae bacterium]|nr:hypothetical protein [Phycisphaerae bacterium]